MNEEVQFMKRRNFEIGAFLVKIFLSFKTIAIFVLYMEYNEC